MIFDDIKDAKSSGLEEESESIFVRSPGEEAPVREKAVRTFLDAEVEEDEEDSAEEPMAAEPVRQRRVRPHISYDEARRLALMKLGFLKLLFGLLIANALFATLSWYQIGFTGQTWFVWPLILSGVLVFFRAIRVFLLKGLDLRGMVNMMVERMTQAELERDQFEKDF